MSPAIFNLLIDMPARARARGGRKWRPGTANRSTARRAQPHGRGTRAERNRGSDRAVARRRAATGQPVRCGRRRAGGQGMRRRHSGRDRDSDESSHRAARLGGERPDSSGRDALARHGRCPRRGSGVSAGECRVGRRDPRRKTVRRGRAAGQRSGPRLGVGRRAHRLGGGLGRRFRHPGPALRRFLFRGRLAYEDLGKVDREGTPGADWTTEPRVVDGPHERRRRCLRHGCGRSEERSVAHRRRSTGSAGRVPRGDRQATRRAPAPPNAGPARRIGPGPIVALVILRFNPPLAAGLLAVFMGASFVYGIVSHFLVPGPDNVTLIGSQTWTVLFVATAFLLGVLELGVLLVAVIAFWAAARTPSEPVARAG